MVVEFIDKITRNEAIRNAKNLRNVTKYSNVYINKDLTWCEIEEEKSARKVRKDKNDELEFEDGGLKYGKMNGGIEYYWGLRFGRVCKINRVTKRML